jgi:hypothetical protein
VNPSQAFGWDLSSGMPEEELPVEQDEKAPVIDHQFGAVILMAEVPIQ